MLFVSDSCLGFASVVFVKVGSVLLQLLMESANVTTPEGEVFPAFEHGYQTMSGRGLWFVPDIFSFALTLFFI